MGYFSLSAKRLQDGAISVQDSRDAASVYNDKSFE